MGVARLPASRRRRRGAPVTSCLVLVTVRPPLAATATATAHTATAHTGCSLAPRASTVYLLSVSALSVSRGGRVSGCTTDTSTAQLCSLSHILKYAVRVSERSSHVQQAVPWSGPWATPRKAVYMCPRKRYTICEYRYLTLLYMTESETVHVTTAQVSSECHIRLYDLTSGHTIDRTHRIERQTTESET